MSGQLESALVIELVDTIKWGAALKPTAADGSLTPIDPSSPLDITKYSRRDRELAYRDLINATAVVKVALHTDTVWNTSAHRPKLQGITGDDLSATTGDIGAVNSTVLHVKNSSLPKDAIVTDKDLAGRDAMVYEVLSKACEVFAEPPITSPGTGVVGQTAWSQAEGVDYGVQPSPSLPLNRNAFYLSDASLAQRDNFIAAYAAKLADILKNPFAFATRLYVKVEGVDARDAEIYSLIRNYYVAGTSYGANEDVFYGTKWYRSLTSTTSVPEGSSDWSVIDSPRLREWTAEPALQFRNRIIYDTESKTLQWFRETSDTNHIPQLYAMSIPGLFIGQTVTTLAQVPERKDCQYWRQKAARIDYNGTTAALASVYQDTTAIGSGIHMTDTIGLTSPSTMDVPLNASVQVGHKYRLSALVKPVNNFSISGSRNTLGLTGTGDGVTFSGVHAPTPTDPGKAIPFSLSIPAGSWYLMVEYTNLGGSTSGFGTKIVFENTTIADDTSPLLFQDVFGNQLLPGTPVTSREWQVISDGTAGTLNFIWTYGAGILQINKITLRTSDRFEAEYFIKADIFDEVGNPVFFGSSPTIESTGRKNVYEILNWDFSVIGNAAEAQAQITWMSSSDLPIQFRKISLSELTPTYATPGVSGFDSFKWECMRRAERSVQTAFNDIVRTSSGTLSDFTADGTVWNSASTENWMSLIEVLEPRLRQVKDVASVQNGFQYVVAEDGYVVYNSGTYSVGEVFNGTSTSSTFTAYGTNTAVDQVGAFRRSAPVDLSHPVLMPFGLWFDESAGLIRMNSTPIKQVPLVVACQPWMVEAGLYAADADFRSSDTASSSQDTATITTVSDPTGGGTTAGAGRYGLLESVVLVATPSSAGSTTSYVDWGLDIAVVIDKSGSMEVAAPYISALLGQLETLLTASGVGTGALPNKYAMVGFGGTSTPATGSIESNFGTYANFAANLPPSTEFVGSQEDGYAGIHYAIANLSWRTSPYVYKIILLISDEDRNYHLYTTGGVTQALQFDAIKAEINSMAGGAAHLIAMVQTHHRDAANVNVLGYRYGGTTYKADGAGGYTTGTGGHGYHLNGYTVSGSGGDNKAPNTYPATSMWEEYSLLAEDATIQGQNWDFGQVRVGGATATSLQKAMVASIVQDITFQVTTAFSWVFVGWYDQNGNLLTTNTSYAFTATESQLYTARFQQV